jgi:hypothetical protein
VCWHKAELTAMRFDYLYLIEPRQALKVQVCEVVEKDLAEIVCEPTLFWNHEGGCRDVWKLEERIAQVKLLFLAGIRDCGPLTSDEDFERVFGSRTISVALFDKFWTTRPLSGYSDEHSDDCVPILHKFLPQVERTGIRQVDSWLDWIAKHPKVDDAGSANTGQPQGPPTADQPSGDDLA